MMNAEVTTMTALGVTAIAFALLMIALILVITEMPAAQHRKPSSRGRIDRDAPHAGSHAA